MYNEDLYEKLVAEFKPEAVKQFCLMTSRMYHHMFETCTHDICNEYDYQRQWWLNKYMELNQKTEQL